MTAPRCVGGSVTASRAAKTPSAVSSSITPAASGRSPPRAALPRAPAAPAPDFPRGVDFAGRAVALGTRGRRVRAVLARLGLGGHADSARDLPHLGGRSSPARA